MLSATAHRVDKKYSKSQLYPKVRQARFTLLFTKYILGPARCAYAAELSYGLLTFRLLWLFNRSVVSTSTAMAKNSERTMQQVKKYFSVTVFHQKVELSRKRQKRWLHDPGT
jgi:hypothetical protein